VTQQWLERHLLPPRPGVSIADVVTRGGWIPSAGGTGPYLSIRARAAKAAASALRIDDIPIPIRRADDAITLLPFRDNLLGLHRGLVPFLDDDDAEVMDTSGRAIPAKDAEMPHHNAVLAGDILRGIWEFDGSRIVTKLFGKPPRCLDAAIAEMETFIGEQLGDHKYYAFDWVGTRRKRVQFLLDR
jgi:hypothetical protein